MNNLRPTTHTLFDRYASDAGGHLALTIPAAVRASGLSRATLYREIAAGRLKVRKCGKRTVILVHELDEFLRALPSP